MKEVTENKSKNPLGRKHAFAYSPILTFWSVFLEIEPIMWRALAINTCILFVLTAFFLKSLFVASVSVVVCCMIVIEVYGVMMMFVQYNTFVATGLIACSGLAVEDVAHFVAAFQMTKGNTHQKLTAAMKHTFAAIILGSVSTFFSILPLAFHYMEFVLLYQLVMFVVLVFFGCINGTIFLPAIMATFGMLTEKPKPDQKAGGDGSVTI